MSADEPDSTPVRREHVTIFLQWYRARCSVPHYTGLEEHWFSALHTLNLGQLRAGMRWYENQTSGPYIEPPAFWAVCHSPRDAARDALFRQMRDSLRTAARRRHKGDE